MAKNLKRPYDRMLIGWFLGTVLPVVIFLIVYLVKYGDIDLIVWVKQMWQMKIFLKLFSLCVFPNLGIFMLFVNKKMYQSGRGVILATFVFAFLVLIAKLM
jgi:hypothetical protein